jgi:hypothetical protein
MCRNIRPLYNYDPPSTAADMEAAALQYVRKVSGYRQPSAINEAAFNQAVADVARATATPIEKLWGRPLARSLSNRLPFNFRMTNSLPLLRPIRYAIHPSPGPQAVYSLDAMR